MLGKFPLEFSEKLMEFSVANSENKCLKEFPEERMKKEKNEELLK